MLTEAERAAANPAQRFTPALQDTLADWITPNLWELGFLTDKPVETLAQARDAARALGRPALITSAPAEPGEIGLLYVDADEAVLFAHPRQESAPSGTGDLVTASFGAGLVEGLAPRAAAHRAARAARMAVEAARAWRTTELPIVGIADRLANPDVEVRTQVL